MSVTMIYNSPHFCVFEFDGSAPESDSEIGGYEIMDKKLRREIFLGGRDAEVFRRNVQELIEQGPTSDEVDEFLQGFSGLMNQPVVLH
ncbi:MAG: BTH_I0359 family protein [Burkholderiaceae bacterium]